MTESETLTIRLSRDIKVQLQELSDSTRRSKSDLASQALTRFIETETEIIAGIKAGLEDVNAGRVVPHAVAVKRLKESIARGASRARAR
jgi:predicted transcriptional regulator